MELHQLAYFVATAETGSVSRAARHCHVAQPSLSQQIRKLESTLGLQLFDRLGRGMSLTEAGRALLPRARRILAEVRAAEANLGRDIAAGAGALAVGVIPTMAPFLAPPAIRRVRQALPTCDISIREELTETLVDLVANNEIDCAILSTPLDNELIRVEVLGAEELLAAGPAHAPRTGPVRLPAARGRASALTLADLRAAPIIALHEFHCLGRQIQGFCAAQHVAPQVRCRAAQLTTVFELVALGLGLSIVPEMAAASQGARRWRYARFRDGALRREIAVAWRRDRTRSRAALEFVAAVRRSLAEGAHALPAPRPPEP